ncbi:PspC domain-containing protein [Nocardioides aurantiacus]|nr:PspC domain-containing protein [Nocardioides aurantiacus]
MDDQADRPTEGTTQTDPGPRLGTEQVRELGRLSRSTSDRYLAGVAGGLGRHFGVDPTVVRVLLAVLALFGGAGLLVYAAVWAFVPEDGRDRAPLEVGAEGRRAVVLVAGLLAVLIVLGTPFAGDGWGSGWGVGLGVPVPLLLLVLVVAALVSSARQRRDREDAPPPAPWGTAPTAASTGAPPAPWSSPAAGVPPTRAYPTTYATPPPPRPRRTGLVLFWPTVALVAIALGVLGILDVGDDVLVSAYAALALAVVALVLLVGAFVGRPGGLVALGLLATLGLGITSAVDAAAGSSVRADETYVVPGDAAALRSSYADGNGVFTLDLTSLGDARALDGRRVAVRIGAGEARVLVPEGVAVRVDAEVAYAGSIDLGDRHREGLNPVLSGRVGPSAPSPDVPVLDLEVDARVGQITVQTEES